jgi:hypothetical protein
MIYWPIVLICLKASGHCLAYTSPIIKTDPQQFHQNKPACQVEVSRMLDVVAQKPDADAILSDKENFVGGGCLWHTPTWKFDMQEAMTTIIPRVKPKEKSTDQGNGL